MASRTSISKPSLLRPRVIRRIPIHTSGPKKPLYLTFDDGPVPGYTESIAAVLERFGVRATFFAIGNQAQAFPRIIQDLVNSGHTIGNHSLDHDTLRFFSWSKKLRLWIEESQRVLTEVSGVAPVAFRSPVGIQTPNLHYVLNQMRLPLVHWDVRFFDTVIPFTPQRAVNSYRVTKPGSVVLLHERQFNQSQEDFLEALEAYIKAGLEHGYDFQAITKDVII